MVEVTGLRVVSRDDGDVVNPANGQGLCMAIENLYQYRNGNQLDEMSCWQDNSQH
jgi:hypothetical protein